MGRLAETAATIAIAGLWVAGCGSTPESTEPTWAEVRAERVREFMLHLNNSSRSERWREGMIEVGRKSPEDRGYVLNQCSQAYTDAMVRGGVGTGVLRAPGRRRVMEIVGKLDDGADGRKLLREGLKDVREVQVAAAASLAGFGDEEGVPILVDAVVESEGEDDPSRQIALQALRRLAVPSRRSLLLHVLSSESRTVLKPIALKSFPEDPQERGAALREVAGDHPNPHARAFALEVLVESGDPAAMDLARAALDQGNPVLRPTALAALGASGGNVAAQEIESVLRKDPEDPDDVVRGLYEVGTLEALERALNLIEDDTLTPKARAALARSFLGRMREDDGPSAYHAEAALEQGRRALRGLLREDAQPLVIACVDALGRIGSQATDVEPVLLLLEDPSPEVAQSVLRALGRLGGQLAAAKLIQFLRSDPQLRPVAVATLADFSQPSAVPVDDLIDLLEEDGFDVRKAALDALMGLADSDDNLGYYPDDDEDTRARAADAWRTWWDNRRG